MGHPWLYIWDFFILITAAVFLLLLIRHTPWWSFLLLMSVAFSNHESALFIGVWMVVKALTDAWAERRRPDWGMLGGGLLGSLGGILLTEFIRTLLLKREIGWKIFSEFGNPPVNRLEGFYYFHLQLPTNLNDIYQWFAHPDVNFKFVQPLPLVVPSVLAVILVVHQGVRAAPPAKADWIVPNHYGLVGAMNRGAKRTMHS